MPFSAGGIPLHLILLTITLFVGSLVFKAALAPAPVRENRPPLRTAGQTTPVQAPMRSLTVTVRSLQQTQTATPTSTATMIPTATLTPAASGTPTSKITPTSMLTPTATLTPTASVTPTSATTPTATVTPTTPMTPSAPLAPPATLTPTPRFTPLQPPLTAEAKAGRTGLAFHPEHLNAGGGCKASYSASGSLKNHGPALATGVDIGYTVIGGAQWVERVEVSPSSWAELGTSKPGRFTVHVHTNDNWPLAGKGTQIVVRLDVQGGTQATFTIKNQCQAEKPDESDKPDKPDKQTSQTKTKNPKSPRALICQATRVSGPRSWLNRRCKDGSQGLGD